MNLLLYIIRPCLTLFFAFSALKVELLQFRPLVGVS